VYSVCYVCCSGCRLARSPVFDWTVQFLVQGLVDNFSQNCTGILSGIHFNVT